MLDTVMISLNGTGLDIVRRKETWSNPSSRESPSVRLRYLLVVDNGIGIGFGVGVGGVGGREDKLVGRIPACCMCVYLIRCLKQMGKGNGCFDRDFVRWEVV